MKTLNDLNLSRRDKQKVRRWLKSWLKNFVNVAEGQEGDVYWANFDKTVDWFFFTNCKDILKDDPGLAQKSNVKRMTKRKRAVSFQLLIKTLLGETVGRKIRCTHCDYGDVKTLSCEGGYWKWCPKCQRVIIDTYAPSYVNAVLDVNKQLKGIMEGKYYE